MLSVLSLNVMLCFMTFVQLMHAMLSCIYGKDDLGYSIIS